MGIIRLTQGKEAYIDDSDFELVSKFMWHAQWDPRKQQFVACSRINGKHVKMHRFITNAPPGVIVDHINWNSLDNRRNNLRLCNAYQSSHNKPLSARNKSGFKGVCWSSNDRKWKVGITANGVHHHGGYFTSLKLAAEKYNELAIEFHKEFAVLNDISTPGSDEPSKMVDVPWELS